MSAKKVSDGEALRAYRAKVLAKCARFDDLISLSDCLRAVQAGNRGAILDLAARALMQAAEEALRDPAQQAKSDPIGPDLLSVAQAFVRALNQSRQEKIPLECALEIPSRHKAHAPPLVPMGNYMRLRRDGSNDLQACKQIAAGLGAKVSLVRAEVRRRLREMPNLLSNLPHPHKAGRPRAKN